MPHGVPNIILGKHNQVTKQIFLQFFSLLSSSLTDYTTGVCLATKHLLITQSWVSHSELDWICIGWDLDSQIWMRTSFLQMEAQEVSASWVSDCVQACTTLWKGIKMKKVFLLSRGLSHTDSQPVSFHEFFMKPLMAMAFCMQPMRRMIYWYLLSYFVVTTSSLTFALRPRADSHPLHSDRSQKGILTVFRVILTKAR